MFLGSLADFNDFIHNLHNLMPPNFSLWILGGLCVAFFVAGFVDSIAGGGGFISTPSLLIAGVPLPLALGTNKFVVIFGTAAATLNFIRHKKILYKITAISIVFALIGGFLGSKALLLTASDTLKIIILLLLPIAAIISFTPRKLIEGKTTFSNTQTYIIAPLISLVVGFYDGYFGPGTGAFLITAFYIGLKMDLLYASASAKAINLASGVGSLIAFVANNSVLYGLGAILIVCNVAGGYIGSSLAIQKGARFIRIIVMLMFAVMFACLVYEYKTQLLSFLRILNRA